MPGSSPSIAALNGMFPFAAPAVNGDEAPIAGPDGTFSQVLAGMVGDGGVVAAASASVPAVTPLPAPSPAVTTLTPGNLVSLTGLTTLADMNPLVALQAADPLTDVSVLNSGKAGSQSSRLMADAGASVDPANQSGEVITADVAVLVQPETFGVQQPRIADSPEEVDPAHATDAEPVGKGELESADQPATVIETLYQAPLPLSAPVIASTATPAASTDSTISGTDSGAAGSAISNAGRTILRGSAGKDDLLISADSSATETTEVSDTPAASLATKPAAELPEAEIGDVAGRVSSTPLSTSRDTGIKLSHEIVKIHGQSQEPSLVRPDSGLDDTSAQIATDLADSAVIEPAPKPVNIANPASVGKAVPVPNTAQSGTVHREQDPVPAASAATQPALPPTKTATTTSDQVKTPLETGYADGSPGIVPPPTGGTRDRKASSANALGPTSGQQKVSSADINTRPTTEIASAEDPTLPADVTAGSARNSLSLEELPHAKPSGAQSSDPRDPSGLGREGASLGGMAGLTSPSTATDTGSSSGVSTATAHTIAKLSSDIAAKLSAKETRFDIELEPYGLGKVQVQVRIGQDGQLSAALNFDNAQSAQDVKARADELRSALQTAGFDLQNNALSFDVNDRGSGRSGTNPDFGGQHRQAGSGAQGAFQSALMAARQTETESLNFAYRPSGRASGLDIRI